MWARLPLLLALFSMACGDEPMPAAPVPEPPPPDPDELTAENMYSLAAVPTFHLELDTEARAALAEFPKVYVQGGFRYGDVHLTDVGIRLKGTFTLVTLAEKPSFKVKFNAFTPGGRFIGLEGLTLHAMHSDPSMMREWLAYLIWRAAGVPAPRTGFAQVVVDGEPYGLYLNLEPYNDDYLADRFDDPSGNLYEGNYGNDLDRDPFGFELDEGTDMSREALLRLSELATQPGGALFYDPDSPLDRAESLAFLAGEAFVGHFDGYRLPANYFMYHEPAADKFVYLPWGVDQAFRRHEDVYAGEGFLTRKCIDEVADCRRDYVLTALDLTDIAEGLDLSGEIDRVAAAIDTFARADTRKRHSNASMDGDRAGLRGFVQGRPAEMRAQLDCLVDGEEPDDDGDGYGPCAHDCADDDPTIHPGAQELCDGVDNDCSGDADDDPACECPSAEIEGVRYYFCAFRRRWLEGRDFCAAQGHQLARIDSEAANVAVWDFARAINGGAWAIGLNDRDKEDTYLWLDGAEPPFVAWAGGEPAKQLPWFDCVFYVGGSSPLWRERNCIQPGLFICSDLPHSPR